jgi:ABC-2 type transport system permease protein
VSTVRAEWTKLRTVPSTGWLLLGTVVPAGALAVLMTESPNVSRCPTPSACPDDLTKLALTGVWLAQVAVAVLAVLAFGNEQSTRLIRTTLAAQPRRWRVYAVRAGVVTAMALAAGAVAVAASLVAARPILAGHGFTVANGYRPLSPGDEPTLRAAVGTVLYLGLIALFGYGVAAILRDTAGAITATLLALFATPAIALFVSSPIWHDRLQRYSPMTAGLAVQVTRGASPIGPWAGLGVLAAYAAAALVAGAVLFRLRDA